MKLDYHGGTGTDNQYSVLYRILRIAKPVHYCRIKSFFHFVADTGMVWIFQKNVYKPQWSNLNALRCPHKWDLHLVQRINIIHITLMRIRIQLLPRIRILLLNKVIGICNQRSTNPPGLDFERPRPSIATALEFWLRYGSGSGSRSIYSTTFLSNADYDTASKINADPCRSGSATP